jgi:hypothetical protein
MGTRGIEQTWNRCEFNRKGKAEMCNVLKRIGMAKNLHDRIWKGEELI